MKKVYLRTDSEELMMQALEDAGLVSKVLDRADPLNIPPEDAPETWQPTGAYTWVNDGLVLDLIGPIYRPTGEVIDVPTGEGDDTLEVQVKEAVPGFHANALVDDDLDVTALPTIAAPTTPYRVWAGE